MGAAKKGLAALDIQWDDGPNATLSTADIVRQMEAASQKPGAVARRAGDLDKAMDGRPVAWHHRITGSSIIARWAPPMFKNGFDVDTIDGAEPPKHALGLRPI
jgi:hypothetical protein